jgi:putative redox protein
MHSDNVSVRWVDKFTFIASTPQGFSVIIDYPENEGEKPKSLCPTEMLLSAIGACTGSDVVHIMRKMRQDLTGLRVEVMGEKTDSEPEYYKHFHIKYIVEGRSISKDSLEKAIHLSHEKYCTVSLTVDGKAKVDWSYEIIEK